MNKLKAVDFYCGGGGMSLGISQAGISVLAGIDNESKCKATYELNIEGAKFIEADVFELKEKELSQKLGLKRNDNSLVLIGCSPCQYWSIINTDKKKSAKSKNLLIEFQRFAQYLNPGYIVVENVPGVLRKKKESGLQDFIDWLKKEKYSIHFDIHNVNDYGVPQNRKRFTLIANRINKLEVSPLKSESKKLVVKDVLGPENGFKEIEAGTKDNSKFHHSVAGLSQINLERLKFVEKDGGDRLGFANNSSLQLSCFKNKENSFKDTFGRLWWNKPSPTITTKFFSVSNGRFVHPNEDRALSIREGATLQSFPKTFEFKTKSIADTARIIGNAVPPEYAKRIGLAILNNFTNNGR
jgi:DNA (cytosine-5)-methyltransferase 1